MNSIKNKIIRSLAGAVALVVAALPGQAAVLEARGLESDGAVLYQFQIPTSAAVNDFSKGIPSCRDMVVYWERGNSGVVSVYPADSDDDTAAEIEANSLIHQFTATERFEITDPGKAYIRFVVDTVNASAASKVVVQCSHFAASGTGGGVLEGNYASIPANDSSGPLYWVNDCATSACSAGGGSVGALKQWNGSSWATVAAGTGIASVSADPAPVLGADLDGDGNVISNTAAVNQVYYPGASDTAINAAIAACGKGSTTDDQGCLVVLPEGTITIDETITIGGTTIATDMQNGISLVGHGPGFNSNLGDHLAGTTLVWAGAAGGTMIKTYGMGHHITDLLLDGDGLAGTGLKIVGDNGTGSVSGKNTIERVTTTGITSSSGDGGYGIVLGDTAGQADHNIFTQVRSISDNHCLQINDLQAVMNKFMVYDCSGALVSPAVHLMLGSAEFDGLFLGPGTTSMTGVLVDTCFLSMEVDTGVAEWDDADGTVFKATNPGTGACNSYGSGYEHGISNYRFQMQATNGSTAHSCINWNTNSTLKLDGNMYTSNNGDALRKCTRTFSNPHNARDLKVYSEGESAGWNNGFDDTMPVTTVTAASSPTTNASLIEKKEHGFFITDQYGSIGYSKDATGAFVDNNGDGNFDAGTDVRLDASNAGDIQAVGGCPSGSCWQPTVSLINDSNGIFSSGSLSYYLDEDESTTATTSFSIKEVISAAGSDRFKVREDGAVTLYGETFVDRLGFEFESGSTLSDCSTFASGGGIYYDSANNKFKKCQNSVLSDLDTGNSTTVATDTIWDAAGDLAVGSGADTASKLTKGSDGQLLRMASGSVGWGDFDVDFTSGDTSDDDDLDVAAGGTGVSSITANAVVLGNGASDLQASVVQIASGAVTGVTTLTASGAITATSFVASDYTSEPGNLLQVNDNDTAFTNDPTCANSGVAGTLTIIDKDETASDNWVVCNGTTELGNFSKFADIDVAETIAADWVNTANPWADNEVADTITASNYLPLAGGTTTGAVVVGSGSTLRPSGTGIVEATEVDSSAGAAPTANGAVLYDSTANDLEYGDNGTNRKVANLDEAQTLTNKTLTSPALSGTVTGNNTIPSSIITTERRTLFAAVDELEVDGAQCVKNAAAVINSGPKMQTITCADSDSSVIYGKTKMPDSWDTTSTITLTLTGFSGNALDSGDIVGTWTASCRGVGETVDNTWATPVTFSTTSGLNGTQYAIDPVNGSAITPNGGCAAGDMLFWKVTLTAATTTAVMTDWRFMEARLEYVSNVGD